MILLLITIVLYSALFVYVKHSYKKTREKNEADLRQYFDSDVGRNGTARQLMRDAGYGV